MNKLKLDRADHAKKEAIQQASANAKLAVAIKFDLQPMMDRVLPGLNSADFSDVVVALLLATGRRTIEILSTAKFTYLSEYRVVFDGQAKKQGLGEVFEIDLLAVGLGTQER